MTTIKDALSVVSNLSRRHHQELNHALADVIPRMSRPKLDDLFALVSAEVGRRDREFEADCAEFSDAALQDVFGRRQSWKRPPLDPNADPSTWF